MTERTAVHRKALSAAEVLALPAMVDGWPDAAAACGGISRTVWYGLVAKGETPVPVVRIGRSIKVRRQSLIDFLGLTEENGASPVYQPGEHAGNDEAARVPAGPPLSSKSAPTRK
ncbi:hypothetical protein QCN29_26970 [Streptomyces sp. HNM0663]|uniref:Helix-turn-helix domain-containing protein n=1 Tax=Streptomyces chengmaiensis TaxID=3040919 RepID=A0ABT6HUI0_9ACTN|nr:hypothetical protein [Streptomyces chengmaiensis]MDH2392355.1 hypothetical protein [Streptomyces chengmaiensis]